ncbi:hypothetical protein [Solimonas sp. SE-A11]|uniref:hypothetical protein n=1 Tax=Solimonas sp. SE-A11 TaxID=3054954 RepID=UPI00259C9252|nr:hypothetical protein [Solimonas sp. SE-A11]MDM4769969.1 hypothetical protein [Solimonas sp. SE-A11]
MLKKLPIPNFTERLYGFTIPSAGKVYACDHDESFEIMLGEAPKIVVLEDNPYEFIGSFENALGAFGGKPIHQINGIRVSYSFDGSEDYVAVVVSLENSSETISFRTLSGDWFVATLSVCGRYLVLAEPYLFECYEFV